MFRFALKVLLVSGMLSAIAFSQGSTGRRPRDLNYVVTRTVSEAIISVDLKNSEVVLKDFDGRSHTVKVNSETKFLAGAKALSLRDLHAGERIRVTYRAADSTALEIFRFDPPQAK